jgi:hypothetical protein
MALGLRLLRDLELGWPLLWAFSPLPFAAVFRLFLYAYTNPLQILRQSPSGPG